MASEDQTRFSPMTGNSGVSSMELRELEHPPQLRHNSKTSISVTTIVTHNRKLVATTNNKFTAL